MTDHLTRNLSALRPPTIADAGWADSPAGRAALAAIHRAPVHRPRSRRRTLVVGVSGAAVFAGGAVAIAAVGGQTPTDRYMVLCNQTASLQANGAGVTLTTGTPTAAAKACNDDWQHLFSGTPTPPRFAVCVYPAAAGQTGGGQVALPAALGTTDAQVCKAAGTVPAV